jgi:anion-transporting  ArsA/GET3 family ATPase
LRARPTVSSGARGAARDAPQPPPPAASLLDRRLVIVTGKGGTGKTTVAAALAVAAARAGRRVLVAEVGREEALIGLLAPGSPAAGHTGRRIQPRLTVMQIDPYAALGEYLELQIGLRAPVQAVLRNRGFRGLMGASPGWRELITLGKVWHLEQMQEAGQPRFDLIVVDAPATGHGVAFLNVPRVVASAVRAGPLRRHSQLVEAMLEDASRTLLLPVALPEELPTRETAELVTRTREELGIRVDRVVVNGVLAAPFPPGLERLDAWLRSLPPASRCGELPAAGALADCAAFLRSRHALQAGYLRLVGELTGLPLVPLPYRVEGIDGPDSLGPLADALLREPEATP